jgi:aminoglycoside 6'-N-acetyltransferase I
MLLTLTIVGFLEMSLRHEYVEGCETSPVAYLEGIFVLGEHRNKGVAKLLVKQAEEWAINAGCTEIASDAEITNPLPLS